MKLFHWTVSEKKGENTGIYRSITIEARILACEGFELDLVRDRAEKFLQEILTLVSQREGEG